MNMIQENVYSSHINMIKTKQTDTSEAPRIKTEHLYDQLFLNKIKNNISQSELDELPPIDTGCFHDTTIWTIITICKMKKWGLEMVCVFEKTRGIR